MKKEEMMQIFQLLRNAFPKFADTQESFSTWFSFFADANQSVVLQAVRAHIAESRFTPTISDIMQRCRERGGFNESKEAYMPESAKFRYRKYMLDRGLAEIRDTLPNGIKILYYKPIRDCEQIGEEEMDGVVLPIYTYTGEGANHGATEKKTKHEYPIKRLWGFKTAGEIANRVIGGIQR